MTDVIKNSNIGPSVDHAKTTPLRRDSAWNLPPELTKTARQTEPVAFDPKKHIKFQPPRRIFTFEDLGQTNDGISTHAVSEPFSLFTENAIQQIRAELFSAKVLGKRYCATSPTSGLIRGHCPEDAPFINSLWNSPEVLRIVSQVAGVELVPAVDYDIGQVNVSINSSGDENVCTAPGEAENEASEFCESAFGWHRDSYPFVVITMLSDCTEMQGGETAIRTGNGQIMKARGPALGTAIVMQGRYVEHQATAARGGRERISMVTSFRPKSPFVKDETILRGVRNISHLPTLYSQYASYRLDNLDERVRDQLRLVRKWKETRDSFDTKQMVAWLSAQIEFLEHMLREFRET